MSLFTLCAIIFLATLVQVFAKAFQQRNVTLDHDLAVIPTSYLMSIDGLIVATFAINVYDNGMSWDLLALMASSGTAGWIGAISAMRFHRRVFK